MRGNTVYKLCRKHIFSIAGRCLELVCKSSWICRVFVFVFFSVVSISFSQDLDTFSFSFKQEASENKFKHAVVTAALSLTCILTAASEDETCWVCEWLVVSWYTDGGIWPSINEWHQHLSYWMAGLGETSRKEGKDHILLIDLISPPPPDLLMISNTELPLISSNRLSQKWCTVVIMNEDTLCPDLLPLFPLWTYLGKTGMKLTSWFVWGFVLFFVGGGVLLVL